MSIKPELLVKPSGKIAVLPNAQNPKLYIPNKTITQRWNHSKLFPAFKKSAKLYRLYLRVKASIGLVDSVTFRNNTSELSNFIGDCFSDIENISSQVLVGTEGPAQKFTAQLKLNGHILGFLKYGEQLSSVQRLKNEFYILQNLPSGIGPEVLKFDVLLDGYGLLSKPIKGKPLSPRLSSVKLTKNLLDNMEGDQEFEIYSHPWIRSLIHDYPGYKEIVEPWIECLSDKSWPLVIQHGDFAPWNIHYEKSKEKIQAIDWEYGNLKGFPYIDFIYFCLQVCSLIYKWKPKKAYNYLLKFIPDNIERNFSEKEIRSLIKLAAFKSFLQSKNDGIKDNEKLQIWRSKVWKEA